MEQQTATSEVLFARIGLEPRKVQDTLKNEALTKRLRQIIELAGHSNVDDPRKVDKAIGNMYYSTAVKSLTWAVQTDEILKFLVPYLTSVKIDNNARLNAAFQIIEKAAKGEIGLDKLQSDFDKHCGIGVTVNAESIQQIVQVFIEKEKSSLEAKQKESKGINDLSSSALGLLKKNPQGSEELKWADWGLVKEELSKQLTAIWPAPSFSAQGKKPTEKKAEPAAKGKEKESTPATLQSELEESVKNLPAPRRIKIRDRLKFIGVRVQLFGWIERIREGNSKLVFLEMRDGTGYVQVVISGKWAKLAMAQGIKRDMSISVTGILELPPAGKTARGGLELQVDSFFIVGKDENTGSIEEIVNENSKRKTQFDFRHLLLRGEYTSTLLKLRSIAIQCLRDHLIQSRGCYEVTPPTIVQTACEGGSELFAVDWFGSKSVMTQSSQLYLETAVPGLGDVFCILPSYRAEVSKTPRHLAEYTHLEVEMGWIDFEGLLEAVEDLVCDTARRVFDHPEGRLLMKRLRKLKKQPSSEGSESNQAKQSKGGKFNTVLGCVPKRPFKRMDYKDAVKFCNDNNIYKDEENKVHFQYGDDIPAKPERRMIEMIGEPVLLCRFPVEMKAFYMQKDKNDIKVTESVDLCVPGVGEILGASMRIWQYPELKAAYNRVGIDEKDYGWYTDLRKYGAFPHGGYGLGVERFLAWMLGELHIKNVCLYPRYYGRCTP